LLGSAYCDCANHHREGRCARKLRSAILI